MFTNIYHLAILLLCCVSRIKNQEMVYRDIWINNRLLCDNQFIKLKRPIEYVMIIDVTAERHTSCYSFSECNILLQEIYLDHTKIWGDIGYNFLIGGDGKIYEGKGWYKQGFAATGFNHLCISVAYIGNFTEDEEGRSKIRSSLENLSYIGTQFLYLKSDFKFLTYSQIISENNKIKLSCVDKDSFESKIDKFVKTLPSWFNGTIEFVCTWITNPF